MPHFIFKFINCSHSFIQFCANLIILKYMYYKTVGLNHNHIYKLIRQIGEGSFGKVYLSSDGKAVKQTNLKLFDQNVRMILANQIDSLKTIKHRNVVELLDYFQEGGCQYMVMEYCQQSLAKYMQNRMLDEKTALGLLQQILQGYSVLLQHQIVHRDLKPENILMDKNHVIKIADFGFSKKYSKFQVLKTKLGSPYYRAPEILSGKQYTSKCDIWSLGIILYQMLQNSHPWISRDQSQLKYKIQHCQIFFSNLHLSPMVKLLILSMLNRNPEKRISWKELYEKVRLMRNCNNGEKVLRYDFSPTKNQPKINALNHIQGDKQNYIINQSPQKKPRIFKPVEYSNKSPIKLGWMSPQRGNNIEFKNVQQQIYKFPIKAPTRQYSPQKNPCKKELIKGYQRCQNNNQPNMQCSPAKRMIQLNKDPYLVKNRAITNYLQTSPEVVADKYRCAPNRPYSPINQNHIRSNNAINEERRSPIKNRMINIRTPILQSQQMKQKTKIITKSLRDHVWETLARIAGSQIANKMINKNYDMMDSKQRQYFQIAFSYFNDSQKKYIKQLFKFNL